jgi:hypothetical protein
MKAMKSKPTDKPQEFIEAMLGTLYLNPAGYAQTAGELNAILWVVHHLWAAIADREKEFIDVRCDTYNRRSTLRIERVRSSPVSDQKAVKVIVDLWKKIDAKMKLDARADQYEQFIP